MPANPEFQELIIKHTALGLRLRKFKCKYTAYGIWKGEEFLKNYIGAVTVSSGMLAAKLVIEELTYRCFLSLSNTHSALNVNSLPFFIENELNPRLLDSTDERITILMPSLAFK
jgi:hypothetical protein